MSLVSLKINHLRNLRDVELSFSSKINLLQGANGSGKTTLLEAIHILAMGRSFRSTQINYAITHDEDLAMISGETHPHFLNYPLTLKMVKYRAKRPEYFLGDQPASSVAELAMHLPVQLLNLDGYQLLGAAPESRRKFIDWMMFHVEHSFFKLWQDFHQVLRQRNAVLKGFGERGQLGYWTERLGELGQAMHDLRVRILKEWEASSLSILSEAPGVDSLLFSYESGWSDDQTYSEYLRSSIQQDMDYGYTSGGPHRGDYKISLGGRLARNVLSTGQQKTFVSMLQFAQSEWVAQKTGKVPVLLVDDLPSELDLEAKKWLMKQLVASSSQVFVTSVDQFHFEDIVNSSSYKMFHVEHGNLQEVV